MVSYKDIYEKLKEFEAQRERVLEVMQSGGLNTDPRLALTLIKEVGQLYEEIKGKEAEKKALKKEVDRFNLVCKLIDEFNGVKASAKKGLDALLG